MFLLDKRKHLSGQHHLWQSLLILLKVKYHAQDIIVSRTQSQLDCKIRIYKLIIVIKIKQKQQNICNCDKVNFYLLWLPHWPN